MNGTKVCSNCNKDIPNDASFCSYCGTIQVGLLPPQTTTRVPDEPVLPPLREQIVHLTELYDDMLAILIPDEAQPILVRGEQKIVLGRSGFVTDPVPTVDLTPYNAAGLGVSRQHAVISRPGDQYVIQDLGSTNGTWVNEVRLAKDKFHELNSGDVVRLGQLTFYVYFKTAAAESPVDTLWLKHKQPDTAVARLTPASLAQEVSPYLLALAGFQTLCNEVLKRPPGVISIDAIQVDVPTGQISVRLRGAKEALKLARDFWGRRQRQAVLSTVPATAPEPTNGLRADTPDTQLLLPGLKELAPDCADDQLTVYLDRFRPHVAALVSSSLQLESRSP
ncbi:MAG: FHA domain-containing protein [Chloroflexi bacterium]|nr:FHA domain-containing protein [Chloroflexota bacterium]